MQTLTDREADAAAILAEGGTRQDVSTRMNISLSTADKHIRALKEKLEVQHHGALTLACARFVANRQQPGASGNSAGVSKVSQAKLAAVVQGKTDIAAVFEAALTFPDLFAALEQTLRQFEVTAISYSHARLRSDSTILHLGTRWNFPDTVQYDPDIPLEENFAIRHAFKSWEPLPLDLEALMASDMHDFLPRGIQRQNEIFAAAGLLRGLIFVMPGLGADDRLICSTLFGGMTQDRFASQVDRLSGQIYRQLIVFRARHIEISQTRLDLSPVSRALLEKLADGASIELACVELGLSRRTGERLIADARAALKTPTNLSLMAQYTRKRLQPELTF